MVREKASVKRFIGVDLVSACANRGSPSPPPPPRLLRTNTHPHAEPEERIGEFLSVIVTSTHTAMWCVLQCKRWPAWVDFEAIEVFLEKSYVRTSNGRTYARLPVVRT